MAVSSTVVAAAVAAGAPDYAGIAALITSISGVIATLSAIYLAARRKSSDTVEEALKLVLELQRSHLEDDDDKDEP